MLFPLALTAIPGVEIRLLINLNFTKLFEKFVLMRIMSFNQFHGNFFVWMRNLNFD